MSDHFLGQIALFPYNFAPYGWASCEGQLLSISQNAALFSLLGVSYGGNGTSNFALPDLRGRVANHQGTGAGLSTYVMGEQGGAENVTVLATEMAGHTHALNAMEAAGTTNSPVNNLLAAPTAGRPPHENAGKIYNPANPDTSFAQTSIGVTGGSQPHNNVQPYLVLRYCIALTGIYPARG